MVASPVLTTLGLSVAVLKRRSQFWPISSCCATFALSYAVPRILGTYFGVSSGTMTNSCATSASNPISDKKSIQYRNSGHGTAEGGRFFFCAFTSNLRVRLESTLLLLPAPFALAPSSVKVSSAVVKPAPSPLKTCLVRDTK